MDWVKNREGMKGRKWREEAGRDGLGESQGEYVGRGSQGRGREGRGRGGVERGWEGVEAISALETLLAVIYERLIILSAKLFSLANVVIARS